MEIEELAGTLDHAILHPTNTDQDLIEGIQGLRSYTLASFCVKPYHVELAVQYAEDIPVCTVIGFPHGSVSTESKVQEVELAAKAGAVEFDMVVNVAKVLQGDWDYVSNDIEQVLKQVRTHEKHILKVIFETDYLVNKTEEKQKLCQICSELGVDYVKTSTGFGFTKVASGDMNYTGATVEDVRLMLDSCSGQTGVKASGGIRTTEDAIRFIEMGCKRIGTGSSLAILSGFKGNHFDTKSKTDY